ncbi:huntingtin-interacting protein 1-related protein isoform X2 [Lates japonicus]|uniref:Huntingtin-interacting protein 1-related protein isoform X2 n=1 Tax=Lates japonicus TaxID=270547 RepID=A0AAD3NIH3_LATJO|nr:huntingtin-interacting protein 1-related protein isoform X2 [Lates japonicus]
MNRLRPRSRSSAPQTGGDGWQNTCGWVEAFAACVANVGRQISSRRQTSSGCRLRSLTQRETRRAGDQSRRLNEEDESKAAGRPSEQRRCWAESRLALARSTLENKEMAGREVLPALRPEKGARLSSLRLGATATELRTWRETRNNRLEALRLNCSNRTTLTISVLLVYLLCHNEDKCFSQHSRHHGADEIDRLVSWADQAELAQRANKRPCRAKRWRNWQKLQEAVLSAAMRRGEPRLLGAVAKVEPITVHASAHLFSLCVSDYLVNRAEITLGSETKNASRAMVYSGRGAVREWFVEEAVTQFSHLAADKNSSAGPATYASAPTHRPSRPDSFDRITWVRAMRLRLIACFRMRSLASTAQLVAASKVSRRIKKLNCAAAGLATRVMDFSGMSLLIKRRKKRWRLGEGAAGEPARARPESPPGELRAALRPRCLSGTRCQCSRRLTATSAAHLARLTPVPPSFSIAPCLNTNRLPSSGSTTLLNASVSCTPAISTYTPSQSYIPSQPYIGSAFTRLTSLHTNLTQSYLKPQSYSPSPSPQPQPAKPSSSLRPTPRDRKPGLKTKHLHQIRNLLKSAFKRVKLEQENLGYD